MSTIDCVNAARTELDELVASRLRGVGQRVTAPRRELVDVLARAKRPLTIPELQQRAPGLATSSAYRNLGVLEDVGVVHRIVTTDDHARYELAEDLTEHHHHLICSVCGGVEDFTAPPALERALARAVGAVADDAGFTTNTHRLDLIGTCTACA